MPEGQMRGFTGKFDSSENPSSGAARHLLPKGRRESKLRHLRKSMDNSLEPAG
jgi:hypothetical protein